MRTIFRDRVLFGGSADGKQRPIWRKIIPLHIKEVVGLTILKECRIFPKMKNLWAASRSEGCI